jgi:hypothetical protein
MSTAPGGEHQESLVGSEIKAAATPIDGPALSDPDTCGEDVARNARRAIEIAPRLCRDCEDFHLLFSLRRTARGLLGAGTDRPKIIEVVGRLVAARSEGTIDILIAGSADSGLLATCAHAALRAGDDALRRTRFTVLDRCETPLELCRDFARRHGLTMTAEATDLVTTTRNHTADIIVHHSLLKFIPPDTRISTLRKFGRWLKPGGRMVFSISTGSASERENHPNRKAEVDVVLSLVESAAMALPESFRTRLDSDSDQSARRHLDNYSADQLRDLFASAGLGVESFERFANEKTMPGGHTHLRERVIAVLAQDACA